MLSRLGGSEDGTAPMLQCTGGWRAGAAVDSAHMTARRVAAAGQTSCRRLQYTPMATERAMEFAWQGATAKQHDRTV